MIVLFCNLPKTIALLVALQKLLLHALVAGDQAHWRADPDQAFECVTPGSYTVIYVFACVRTLTGRQTGQVLGTSAISHD